MKVYVSRPIPQNAYKILKDAGLEVFANEENRILSKQELIENIKDVDALLPLLTDAIDDEVLASNPKLKIVANYAVGFNNINIEAATKRGILVTNTPDVLTDTTADMAFALLMTTARSIVPSDKFTRDGMFDKWEPLGFLGQDIHHATLGIIGAGRIGQVVAKRGHHGFDMKILYVDMSHNEYMDSELGATKVELDYLLQNSDFVSLHVPLFPNTHHLIGKDQFKMMKKTAVLINTARGPVVDEEALVEALKTGEIWAAGLDVYEKEPTVHHELLKMDNVVLAPHIASASIQTREEMGRIAAENIVLFLNGKKPLTPVNPAVLQ